MKMVYFSQKTKKCALLAVKLFPEDKIDSPTSSNRTPDYEAKKKAHEVYSRFLKAVIPNTTSGHGCINVYAMAKVTSHHQRWRLVTY